MRRRNVSIDKGPGDSECGAGEDIAAKEEGINRILEAISH
jgi:hypothetical protein